MTSGVWECCSWAWELQVHVYQNSLCCLKSVFSVYVVFTLKPHSELMTSRLCDADEGAQLVRPRVPPHWVASPAPCSGQLPHPRQPEVWPRPLPAHRLTEVSSGLVGTPSSGKDEVQRAWPAVRATASVC